ncbi:cell division protein ZipA [Saccharospirillum sp.]|uniref:cell division protein ZipA n=1 Tax=Saccharospirillum sp. TaxID=2033801 RepID=UPI0034A043FC
MELREVLIILGIVLIAVIVWDGLRRMKLRIPKTRRPITDLGPDPEEEKKKAELARELPNGGARVRDMTEQEREVISSKLNLRERVPMLMDSVDAEPEPDAGVPPAASQRAEQQPLDFDREPDPKERAATKVPGSGAADGDDSHRPISAKDDAEQWDTSWHFSAVDDEDEPDRDAVAKAEHDTEKDDAVDEPRPDDTYREAAQQTSDDEDEADTGYRQPEPTESGVDTVEENPEPAQAATTRETQQEPEYREDTRPVEALVIMHVMARDKGEIAGDVLLELLLRAGLRFGPLDIFHYRNPQGQMEFSLANSVQPGTLNPDAMDQMATPGVTLFMQLPLRADMMTSFDHMYEMAVYLSKNLDADLLDEEHSTVTPQRVEHYRERLRNFARSQLIQAHE